MLATERTAVWYGMHQDEIRRMRGAIRYMQKRRCKLFLIVIGDKLLSLSPEEALKEAQAIRSHLMVLLKRAGLPTYWLEVWEVDPELHVNLIAPATEEIARKIVQAYPDYFVGGYGEDGETGQYAVQPVYDVRHLKTYLSKQRTARASDSLRMPRQKIGRFPNKVIGDRVRLSRALKRHAIEAGDVKDWQRTNAKRSSSRKDRKPARLKTTPPPLENWLPLPASLDSGLPDWFPIGWMDNKQTENIADRLGFHRPDRLLMSAPN